MSILEAVLLVLALAYVIARIFFTERLIERFGDVKGTAVFLGALAVLAALHQLTLA